LFVFQVGISFYALIHTLILFLGSHNKRNRYFALAAVATSGVAVFLMWATKLKLMSSMHNQGPENLAVFIATAAVACLVGIQITIPFQQRISLASDCPECGYSLRKLPKRVCPECGFGDKKTKS